MTAPDADADPRWEQLWAETLRGNAMQLLQALQRPLPPEFAIALCQAWLRQAQPAERYVGLFQLGSLQQRLGQHAEAAEQYRACLSLQELPQARYNLGLVLEQLGQEGLADEQLQRLGSATTEPGLRRQALVQRLRLARRRQDRPLADRLLALLEPLCTAEADRRRWLQLRAEHEAAAPAQTGGGESPLRITVMACCFNEAAILPFFIEHYQQFVGATRIVLQDGGSTDETAAIVARYPGVELVVKRSEKLDDRELLQIRNEAWKPWRDEADWMIVCDVDEFLYHPDIKAELRRLRDEGVTLPMVEGFEMLSKRFPEHRPDRYLWQDIQAGFAVPDYYNKNLIFDPRIDINYHLGCHSCAPTGPVRRSEGTAFRNLHYRMLSHQHIVDKSRRAAARLSDWNRQSNAGFHYRQHAVMPEADYNRQFLKASNVVAPRPRPRWNEARERLFQRLGMLSAPAQVAEIAAGVENDWSGWCAWYGHAFGGGYRLLDADSRLRRHAIAEIDRRGLTRDGQLACADLDSLRDSLAGQALDLVVVGPGQLIGDAEDLRHNAQAIAAQVAELLPLLAPDAALLLHGDAGRVGVDDPFQFLRPWLLAQGWAVERLGEQTLYTRLGDR